MTECLGEQELQWPWRASKGFLLQMLCARTPATLLLDLSVAANATITDTHVALAALQGSRRGAGKAKLKRSFAPLGNPAGSTAASVQRSHVSEFSARPVSGVLLFAVLQALQALQLRRLG